MTKYACSLFLVLAFAALPAAAAEVVYFVNGSEMPVISHWVEDGMIYVELDGNGVMAFPEALVEKIDTNVRLSSSRTGDAATRGRMAAGDRGTGTPRQRSMPRKAANTGLEVKKNPAAVNKLTKVQQDRAKRRQPAVQPGRVASQGRNLTGATPRGDRYVIEGNKPRPKIVEFQGRERK